MPSFVKISGAYRKSARCYARVSGTYRRILQQFVKVAGSWVEVPFWGPAEKVYPADYAQNDQIGCAVAISGDTLVVGANLDDDDGSASGSAYVFVRSGHTWAQQAKLTPSDGQAVAFFGSAVAIDGDTVVIGAYLHDGAGTDAGAAYVFTRSGTTWTQQQKLLSSDIAADDKFGWSVAVDGDLIVVGAPQETSAGSGNPAGAAYVFTRTAGVWSQEAKLTGSNTNQSDQFGSAVAISGETVVVGADTEDSVSTAAGAAYVFTRSGGSWPEQARLTPTGTAASANFGEELAISGDTLAVAAPEQAPDKNGKVYVFTRSGSTWDSGVVISPPVAQTNQEFGGDVSIDGDTLVVGAPTWDTSLSQVGQAHVYVKTASGWTLQQTLTAPTQVAPAQFGYSVAIDGDHVAIGAFQDTVQSITYVGAVYVF